MHAEWRLKYPAGDVGHGKGKLYAVNVPLMEGMDDESYKYVFEPVMAKVSSFQWPLTSLKDTVDVWQLG